MSKYTEEEIANWLNKSRQEQLNIETNPQRLHGDYHKAQDIIRQLQEENAVAVEAFNRILDGYDADEIAMQALAKIGSE